MAISSTYNTYVNLFGSNVSWMNYDDSAGTYTGNITDTRGADYFPDTAAVEDILYIGSYVHGGGSRRNLKFTVDTAFVATSVTFIWEYYSLDNAAWTELPSVTNANAFESTGEQIVTWGIVEDYGKQTINGRIGIYVRCRITAISGITEGGSQDGSTHVQYGNNLLKVTGGTSGTPIDMSDVLSEADTQEVGLIVKTILSAVTMYVIKCYLQFDGYFQIDNSILIFRERYEFTVSTGWVKFGQVNDSDLYLGKNACYIYTPGGGGDNNVRFSGTMYLYGSFLQTPSALIGGSTYMVGSLIAASQMSSATLFDYQGTSFQGLIHVPPTTLNTVDSTFSAYIAYQNKTGTVDGCKIKTVTHRDGNVTTYLDTTITSITFADTGAGASDGVATFKWRFDLHIQDKDGNAISGATVDIVDNQGTKTTVTTDASGDIAQQQLIEKITTLHYPNEVPATTTVTYTPYTVTISKTGYVTKVIQYTIDQKRVEIETLENRREV